MEQEKVRPDRSPLGHELLELQSHQAAEAQAGELWWGHPLSEPSPMWRPNSGLESWSSSTGTAVSLLWLELASPAKRLVSSLQFNAASALILVSLFCDLTGFFFFYLEFYIILIKASKHCLEHVHNLIGSINRDTSGCERLFNLFFTEKLAGEFMLAT